MSLNNGNIIYRFTCALCDFNSKDSQDFAKMKSGKMICKSCYDEITKDLVMFKFITLEKNNVQEHKNL